MGTDSKRTQHGKRGGNSKAGSTGRGLNKREENANKREPVGGSSESQGADTARSRTPAKDD